MISPLEKGFLISWRSQFELRLLKTKGKSDHRDAQEEEEVDDLCVQLADASASMTMMPMMSRMTTIFVVAPPTGDRRRLK